MDKAIVLVLLLCDSVWMRNNHGACASLGDNQQNKDEAKLDLKKKQMQ